MEGLEFYLPSHDIVIKGQTVTNMHRMAQLYSHRVLGLPLEYETPWHIQSDPALDIVLAYAESMGFELHSERNRPLETAYLNTVTEEPKIYSTYWGNLARMEKYRFTFVSVAAFSPKVKRELYEVYKPLAPNGKDLSELKRGDLSKEEYRIRYGKQLQAMDPDKVAGELMDLAKDSSHDIVICCYEKPPQTCHRYRIAKWLEPVTGKVRELPFVP